VAGSWILETGDDAEAVRRFYEGALGREGLDLRPAPPPQQAPKPLAYLQASEPEGARFIGVRIEPRQGPGTRAEIYYQLRR
jgi:hypothetical protein